MGCKGATEIWIIFFRIALFIVLIVASGSVAAQISNNASVTHRQDLKYGLQEAREVESVYKETHLNLDNRNFKKGEPARKQVKRKGERIYYKSNRRSNAIGNGNRTTLVRTRNKSKP